MTFGAPYSIDTDAIAEWNAANQRAREAYFADPNLCVDCGKVPRRSGLVCNPCRYKRDAVRKANR